MNVWLGILIFIVSITVFIILVSLLICLGIAFYARIFSTTVRRKHLRKLKNLLPGNNCGGCGYKTCSEYAYCVFYNQAEVGSCVNGSPQLSEEMERCLQEFQSILDKQ